MTNLLSLILAALMPLCSTIAPIESMEPLPQGIAYIETEPLYGDEEITALAKLIWGEARGIASDTEKAPSCGRCLIAMTRDMVTALWTC